MTPQQAKQEAIEQVKENNKAVYLAALGFAQEWVKYRNRPFTTTDLKTAFFEANIDTNISEGRVWGAVINMLSKCGQIKSTGRWINSSETVCHGRPQAEWISLDYSRIQQSNAKKKQATLSMF